jgi:adenylosuccinate lyase
MKKIWSEENKFSKMLEVELAVCEGLMHLRIIPKNDYAKIIKGARLNLKRVKEIEKITKHDLAAFVDQISENLGKEARWIHYGLTSSDVLDTVTALQLKESSLLLIKKLNKFAQTLKNLALKYKNTVMLGRTHGIQAEPITFGWKLLTFYSEIKRHLQMLGSVKEVVRYGKISCAVGTYAHLDPKVEEQVMKKIGLRNEPVSTQIIPRDRYAVYLSSLAIIASSLEKFATEIRNLQRSEIAEVEEYFSAGQKGSSAMPHKRNPILSENLCGLARLMRSYCLVGLENIPLWHERDISHSSAERIVLPDASILLDFMLTRIENIFKNLVVYPENMQKNLEKSYRTYFSQKILLKLIEKGLKRDDVYRIVQELAHQALEEKKDFVSLVEEDKEIKRYLTGKEIKECLEEKSFLKNIDQIFARFR